MLDTLVQQGWGKNWGVYLTCDQPPDVVRKHFRHFLMVVLPDGKQAYFRFYDPRVLRVFLPTCAEQEANLFFGPVRRYVVEDDQAEGLLSFSNTGHGIRKDAQH